MAAIERTLRMIGSIDGGLSAKAGETIGLWLARAEARRELAELSDRMILDVGLDLDETQREIAKPFWKA